jgi:hypothetical protein
MSGRAVSLLLRCLALTFALSPAPFAPAWAAPTTGGSSSALPPVVEDTTKAAPCTITWLVTNIVTSDTFAVRMQIAPDPNDRPVNNLMPCPRDVPPRVASRALDACILRAADPKDCVFADMARGFEQRPNAENTAENASRCASDKASDIGVACWRSGALEVCGAGCGASPEAAIAAAVSRCESKHQQQCKITGSRPVLAPR